MERRGNGPEVALDPVLGSLRLGAKTTYNADNEQTKFNGTLLSYDSNGNLLSDGTSTYTWNARNHLTAISAGATASFVYDGFGWRMSKTVGGTATQSEYRRVFHADGLGHHLHFSR